ncbi:MAG TPA: class I adenylate-forming enzyme family protein [Acidimicrobiales bacterium]|jgi:acyl-CoA synthetase (AMP-forming)/AMP-acid ligase II|nr:class I adenylate-forming enzyme family protein [Acidimicrobiales bacterium]
MTVRQISGEFETVTDVLRTAAAVNGDAEAHVEPRTAGSARQRMTFAEWDRAADGVAGLLARQGAGRGSVVCLMLPSSIDYMVCYAGAARLGAVTSGINLRLGGPEVTSILGRTRPAVTVVEDGAPRPVGPLGAELERSEVRAAAGGPPPTRWPTLSSTDPVAVVWTSGTTGRPKGAVFDHRCLAAVAAGTDVLSEPGDRRLSPLPFAHVGSMTRVWDEIASGVTTVITPTPWRAAEAIAILVEERITVAQGVPTQWALILSHPGLVGATFTPLRIVGTGASTVPAELVAALRNRFGVPVVVRYTSTESSLGTGTVPGDADHVVATTVGRPVGGVELSVVDAAGRPVAVGEVGRVRLRSAAVMRGYWGGPPSGPGATGVVYDADATREVLADDGWLTTGDSGRLDATGCLKLVGRSGERYIRGGYNVYPAEVEGVLSTHRAVDQVAVVAAPDPVLGEIGVAFVVPASGAKSEEATLLADLRAAARSALADYKAPDRLVVVDSLPLTSMMKVDKRPLAQRAASLPPLRSGCSTGSPDHHRPEGEEQATDMNGARTS